MNSTNYPEELYKSLVSKLEQGDFDEASKNLFQYQKNVFNVMTDPVLNKRGILLYHSVGSGKCMGIDTPILMYDGSLKKIQNVVAGDLLMGDNSESRSVIGLARGVDDMYNVWYGNTKYTVNKSHILCLKASRHIYPKTTIKENGVEVEYIYAGARGKSIFSYDRYDYNKDLTLHLANTFSKQILNRSECNILHISVVDYLKLSKDEKNNLHGYRKKIYFKSKPLLSSPLLIGALSLKSPDILTKDYIINSIDVREYVLAGVIGSAGILIKYKGKHAYRISLSKEKKSYINDLVFIANTLGLLFRLKKKENVFDLIFYGRELLSIHNKSIHNDIIISPGEESYEVGYKINVKYAGVSNYFGFEIDGNRRYVLGDCTITHNTMTSVSIAEFFRKTKREIIVLSSKSLQINYKKEIHAFRKLMNNESEDEDTDGYKFITSNARNMIDKLENVKNRISGNKVLSDRMKINEGLDKMLEQINKQSLDNKIIIVDEAHNLFNSIANGSANANAFYDMIIKAKNVKIIFMTGTPIINDPFELSICYNMLAGDISNKHTSGGERNGNNKSKKGVMTILPEYYTDFVKYFIAPNGAGLMNENKFKNRIYGMTSYYGDLYTSTTATTISQDLKQTSKKENYPDRLPVKFEVVQMSSLQSSHYIKARDVEKLENGLRGIGGGCDCDTDIEGAGIQTADKGKSSTSYRIKSRQISNIYIPAKKDLDKEEDRDSIFSKDKIGLYSTKIDKLLKNIEDEKENPGNIMIYSTFLEYGVEAVASVLKSYGYNPFTSNDEENLNADKRYAIFSGKQTEEEKIEILKLFNSAENKNGDIIKILMITKSGTEGLDLKNVRYIHIMEPYWNFSLIQQIIARGVRYKSHIEQPEEFRNVQTFIYLSDYNEGDLLDIKKKQGKEKSNTKKEEAIEKTTDIHMISNAIKNQELIYKFLKAIASTSIECGMYNKDSINYECYTCKPTGQRLYIEDIHVDMKTRNNCDSSKIVKAKEVIIDDVVYYYTEAGGAENSFRLYKKTEDGRILQIQSEEIKKQIYNNLENSKLKTTL